VGGHWLPTGDGGVPPDGCADNSPADIAAGHDVQIEKAVEVLKAELAGAKRQPLDAPPRP
jgi:hypothetical protein